MTYTLCSLTSRSACPAADELVDDPSTDAIIHWYKNESSRDASKSGEEESDAPDAHGPEENGFVVERFEDFTTELLPRLSKSTSFCSFVRQLNDTSTVCLRCWRVTR